jgi:hypothetical protein
MTAIATPATRPTTQSIAFATSQTFRARSVCDASAANSGHLRDLSGRGRKISQSARRAGNYGTPARRISARVPGTRDAPLIPEQEDDVSDSVRGRAPCGSAETPRVTVNTASGGGWNIQVELDGGIAITAHCTDWHRVERRRAQLEAALKRIAGTHHDAAAA